METVSDNVSPLSMEERSAYGQGWETKRNGGDMVNPFPVTDWRWIYFNRGFLDFRPSVVPTEVVENCSGK
jgi:hypothetical protein